MKIWCLIILSLCSCKKIFQTTPEQGELFSIDSSGLVAIPGIDTTPKAGNYATQNNFIEAPKSLGLVNQSVDDSTESVNRRCGIQAGMKVAMALSYYAEQTTGQLSGVVVDCSSMSGRVPKSVQWQPGELCFMPEDNTTKQLVLAPGQDFYSNSGGSLFSMTEYCKVSTNFFLALSSNAANKAPNELADQTYKGIAAAKGPVNVDLAGLSFRYGSQNNMVVKHVERSGGFALESDAAGGIVNAYFDGQASQSGVENGFRGLTFDEKGNIPAVENGVVTESGAPPPEMLGLYQQESSRGHVQITGGAVQVFFK